MNPGRSNGVYADNAWFDSWDSNPPREGYLRINGATPLSRVERLRQRWQAQVRTKQLDRYEVLREQASTNVADADATSALVSKTLEEWLRKMRSGALDPGQVVRDIAELAPAINAVRDAFAGATRDADAAAAMIDMSPAMNRPGESGDFLA